MYVPIYVDDATLVGFVFVIVFESKSYICH